MSERRQRNNNMVAMTVMAVAALATAVGAAEAARADVKVTAAEKIMLGGPTVTADLQAIVVGSGIEGAPATTNASAGGQVVWKQYRDETDELGMRHVFYRQTLMPGADLARALGRC